MGLPFGEAIPRQGTANKQRVGNGSTADLLGKPGTAPRVATSGSRRRLPKLPGVALPRRPFPEPSGWGKRGPPSSLRRVTLGIRKEGVWPQKLHQESVERLFSAGGRSRARPESQGSRDAGTAEGHGGGRLGRRHLRDTQQHGP